MPEQKIYIHAFISACISIFIPLFVWGNIIAFLSVIVGGFLNDKYSSKNPPTITLKKVIIFPYLYGVILLLF